jgi:hypothetical protein
MKSPKRRSIWSIIERIMPKGSSRKAAGLIIEGERRLMPRGAELALAFPVPELETVPAEAVEPVEGVVCGGVLRGCCWLLSGCA